MATNLSIDPELIERALEVSGERTKRAAVTKALEEFIARRRQKKLLGVKGVADAIGYVGWLELEYSVIPESVPLRVGRAECFDNLHQVIEDFERIAGV